MALFLPALLDMVDEMYTNLEVHQQPNEGGFPFVFIPPKQSGCRRAWSCGTNRPSFGPRSESGCQRSRGRCPCSATCKSTNDFQVNLNFKEFSLEEISVKTKDHEIIVEAKHEEKSDEFGFVTRQITRRLVLPEQFDPNTVTSNMSSEGVLTIKASKPKETTSGEKVIPVQRVDATEEGKPEEKSDEKPSEPKVE